MEKTSFRTLLVCVALLVVTRVAEGQTNFIFDSNVTVNSNLTAYTITLNSQTLSDWPGLETVLSFGADAGNQPLTNISYISVNDESEFDGRVDFHNRVNIVGGMSGRGAMMISPDSSDIDSEAADFAVAYNAGDYLSDSQPGDTCIRALTGSIRIGYIPNIGTSSSVIIATNGVMTLTRGALILTPQGDLSMGSFTNSP